MFKQMQELAEGKIECSCGNNEWKQFIYISSKLAASDKVAGCKRCGAILGHVEGAWKVIAEPKTPQP